MKKTFLRICAVALCFVMTACAAKSEPYARGTWENDTTYKNTYADLTMQLPEGWVYASDEEMSELFSVSMEMLDVEGLKKSASEIKTIYDFLVQDPTTGSNINLVVENLGLTPGGSKVDEVKYHELAAEQLEKAGIEFTAGALSDVTINKATYKVSNTTLTMQGTTISQVQALRKVGNYMMVITCTPLGDDTAEDLLAFFS